MSGCSPAALDGLLALISDGSRSLLKVQEAARAIFDKEENRILSCFSIGCVLSNSIVSGSFPPVSVINALWILFDSYRSEGPAKSPFLHTFCHVLKHHKAPAGMQFFIRHLINYPSEKFAANQTADKILLLDDSHARMPLSPNVDVAALQSKSTEQLGPSRRLSSGATAWLHDSSLPHSASSATPPVPSLSSLMSSCGFEAPFPRPPPPALPISARELRWLNPFPEPDFVFCEDLMYNFPPFFPRVFTLVFACTRTSPPVDSKRCFPARYGSSSATRSKKRHGRSWRRMRPSAGMSDNELCRCQPACCMTGFLQR